MKNDMIQPSDEST